MAAERAYRAAVAESGSRRQNRAPMMRRGRRLLWFVLACGACVLAPASVQAATRVFVAADGTLTVTNQGGHAVGVVLDRGRYVVYTGETVRPGSACRRDEEVIASCGFSRVRGILFDLRDGTDSAVIGESVPVPVEVRGGRGDDYLEAGQNPRPLEYYEEPRGPVIVPVRFDGGPGVDTLIGGDHEDVLIGGPGPDRLHGGGGADSLFGAAGDDLLLSGDGAADGLDCGAGADRLRPDGGLDTLAGCEQPPTEYALEESPAIVGHRFAAYRDGRTRLTRLRARALPAGASVTVRCTGRGCPFEAREDRAAPRWSAPAALTRRRLGAGARIEVTVAAPGHLTKIVRLAMRRRAGPSRRVYCAGPLSGLVTTCLSATWAPGQGVAD
jgi:RTX calcium-binding nonapeptide repeat (4 copies)